MAKFKKVFSPGFIGKTIMRGIDSKPAPINQKKLKKLQLNVNTALSGTFSSGFAAAALGQQRKPQKPKPKFKTVKVRVRV